MHIRALEAGLADRYDIYTLAPEKNQLEVIQNQDVLFRLPADEVVFPMTPYQQPQTERALAQALERIQPDIIHIQHFHNWPIGVIDQLLETRKPVVMSFHDYYAITPYFTMQGAANAHVALSPEYSQLVFQADITPYLQKRFLSIKKSLERCRAFIVPSNFLAEQLRPVLPLPYQVVPHGIRSFQPQPLVREAKNRFGCIGSKLPQKGWMELLKAFQILQSKHPKAEIVFFGGGQKAPAQASPGVQFHGAYNQEDLPFLMSQFEIGVLPSLFAETFSYTLSELWAGGKPVAASRIGALSERITPRENGLFFEPGNIQSMVETLGWFLETDEWREWKLPEVRPVSDMLEDYHNIYRSLLNS